MLVLWGFMGSGKSSVGKALAESSGFTFVDTDDLVFNRYGTGDSLGDWIRREGWDTFRDCEQRVLERLCRHPSGGVVALGGGALREETIVLFQHPSIVTLWLKADLELCLARTLGDRNRPVLDRSCGRLGALYEERLPYYKRANFIVEIDANISVGTVVERIQRLVFRKECGN